MTKDEIIRMAREAGLEIYLAPQWDLYEQLERFAALIASRVAAAAKAEEREACAKLCEPKRPRPCDCEYCDCGNSGDRAAVVDWDASNALAAAIRARSDT